MNQRFGMAKPDFCWEMAATENLPVSHRYFSCVASRTWSTFQPECAPHVPWQVKEMISGTKLESKMEPDPRKDSQQRSVI